MITHEEVRRRLREHVTTKYGTTLFASEQLGCSQGHLSEMIGGKRPIADWLLAELGLQKRRVWIYYDADETPVLPCGAQVYSHHNRPEFRRKFEGTQ